MDMSKIKGHPGFMPFGHVNVKINKSETQSGKEEAKSQKDNLADSKVSK